MPRVDDRRVISGILDVLRPGCRWKDCPPEVRPATTIDNRWSAQGPLTRVLRQIGGGLKHPGRVQHRQHACQGPPLCGRVRKGEQAQATRRSRGGRTSKIHALANAEGKPIAFMLTPGNVADISVAATLLDNIALPKLVQTILVSAV